MRSIFHRSRPLKIIYAIIRFVKILVVDFRFIVLVRYKALCDESMNPHSLRYRFNHKLQC